MAFAFLLSAFVFAPTAQATNGAVKDMTFLLHSVNATETAKPLPGGGSTLTYFDTTLDFNDVNVSILVSGTQKVLQWFLSPALAGNFSADGFTLRIWANSSTSASSNAQVTLAIYEVNATTLTLVNQNNLGSLSFPVTPTLTAWSSTFASPHTFLAGSSMELRMTVTPGALQGIWFHYDTAQFNSRVSFRGPDSIDVAQIVTLDAARNPTASFDPLAADKTMYVQARVTDPIGGYDVRWVNATILNPSGTILVDNASMTKVSGTPVSFESVYELTWNYGGQPTGPYTVLVWALDNNGHNHYFFFQQFTYADYPDVGTAVFYIGGLPFYMWVRVVDSLGLPLEQAFVNLSSGGNPIDSGATDARGMVNLTAFGGTYDLRVTWADVLVAQASLAITQNVSESDPYLVNARVYYPAIRTIDDAGVPLSNAAVYLVHPNGSVAATPLFTNDTGEADLGRLPGGTLEVRILWRGVEVAHTFLTIDANAPPAIDVRCAVYYLTVTVTDSRAAPLAGAQVVLADSVYGLVADARITDAAGTVVSRLPAGTYDIGVTWNDIPVSTGNTVVVDATKGATVLAQVYYLTVTVLDSRSAPVPAVEIVAESLAGRAFTAAVSDGDGQAVLRVPATQVHLTGRWLGVDVGSMTVEVTGDAPVSFTVDVFTLDLTVIDGNGAPLPGAQLAIEAAGRIFALEVTDAAGRLSVRLPNGTYTVRARFTAEYLYTHVDASSEATVALTEDVEKTIQIGAYPPPVTSTVAFGFGLLAAVLAAGLSFMFYMLGKRRGKPRAPSEAPAEPEKGGEQK